MWGWFLLIHEIDYHILTIQLDAKSRNYLFGVGKKIIFCWNLVSF